MSDAMITRRGGGGGKEIKLQTKFATPSTSSQDVLPGEGFDALSKVTVNPIPNMIPAATITPGAEDQTINAGQWLFGAQTIKGDANLVAANIKKGVSIFGIAGAYEAGLDTDSAILKVVTSTGCSVTVTNGTDTFTQQAGQGFVRPNDANVTEHFFVIPTAAFGTYSVTSTHPTYGDNPKTNAVVIGEAGKVYEVLCGGKNIILDGTFGLQDGYVLSGASYDEREKCIIWSSRPNPGTYLMGGIPVTAYSSITIYAEPWLYNDGGGVVLKDADDTQLAGVAFSGSGSEQTNSITNKYYATAILAVSVIRRIRKIILT